MKFEFESIGEIHSCYTEKFGTPRQPQLVNSSLSKIFISEKFQPEISLQGLEKFSHLWILFVFHLNQNARFHAKVHPPRLNGETMGLFATRTPHRPNPIGLSLVEIVKLDFDGLWVRGVDIVHGTPVLDIKPYLPHVESRPQADVGWLADQVQQQKIEISWQAEAENSFQSWAGSQIKNELIIYKSVVELKTLVEELIQQDPRPLVYKGYEGEESPYRNTHVMLIYNCDIHFRFLDSNRAEIFKCEVMSLNHHSSKE